MMLLTNVVLPTPFQNDEQLTKHIQRSSTTKNTIDSALHIQLFQAEPEAWSERRSGFCLER